jgi:hypothetical protein
LRFDGRSSYGLKTQLVELDPKAEAAMAQHRNLMECAFIDREEWPKKFITR